VYEFVQSPVKSAPNVIQSLLLSICESHVLSSNPLSPLWRLCACVISESLCLPELASRSSMILATPKTLLNLGHMDGTAMTSSTRPIGTREAHSLTVVKYSCPGKVFSFEGKGPLLPIPIHRPSQSIVSVHCCCKLYWLGLHCPISGLHHTITQSLDLG